MGKAKGGLGSSPRFSDVPAERFTRRDLIVSAVIGFATLALVATVVFSGTAWRSSLSSAAGEIPSYHPSTLVPSSLTRAWDHHDSNPQVPVVTRSHIVAVDQGALRFLNAATGAEEFAYTRPGELCGARFFANRVAALYNDGYGCQAVTAIDASTGLYAGTRSSVVDDIVTMDSTWDHVLAYGPTRLEVWRSDLVRTIEYGRLDAPQEANQQPRSGCSLLSSRISKDELAVAERCPNDESVRLSVTTLVPKDSRKPEDKHSEVTGAEQLDVIGQLPSGTLALAKRSNKWTVELFSTPSESVVIARLAAEPKILPSPSSLASDKKSVRWFDGEQLHSFDSTSGKLNWSLKSAIGPGNTLGWGPGASDFNGDMTHIAVPTKQGYDFVRIQDGKATSAIAVDRQLDGNVMPISSSQVADILVEKIGDTVIGYKMTS